MDTKEQQLKYNVDANCVSGGLNKVFVKKISKLKVTISIEKIYTKVI